MTSTRVQELISELDLNVPKIQANELRKVHWTIVNRIPVTYGKIYFRAQIGLSAVNHHNEFYESYVLKNTPEGSEWNGVSKNLIYAKSIVCRVIFDTNNSLTEVFEADDEDCIISTSWTVEPKRTINHKILDTGEVYFTDIFDLKLIQ